jgi:hypothetical protein
MPAQHAPEGDIVVYVSSQHDSGRTPPDPQRLEQRDRILDAPVGVVKHHQHRRHHAGEPLDARCALRQGAAYQPSRRSRWASSSASRVLPAPPMPVTTASPVLAPATTCRHQSRSTVSVAALEPHQPVLGAQQPQG